MKVLIFSPQFKKGALELLDKELAINLMKLGVNLITLSMYSNTTPVDSNNSLIPKKYFLNLPVNPNIFDLFIGILKLRKLIHKEKIEIIETSSESLSILTSIACFGTKVNHVIGIHKSYNRKKGYKNNRREIILLILTKLHRKTFFYSVSEFSKKAWINFSKTKEDKIKVIYNSINFSNCDVNEDLIKQKLINELCIPRKSKIIISVGRICEHKRQDFIVKSIGPILKQNNLHLLLVGDIDFINKNDKTLERIYFYIKKYDIKPFVKLIGYRKDVQNLMRISDIFVHSTLTEAFGLVLIEAMAMGLTVISSKVEAIPELVKEPDNFLVRLDDHKSFRRSVETALSRTNKLKEEVSNRNIRIGKSKKFSNITRAKIMYDYFLEILEN